MTTLSDGGPMFPESQEPESIVIPRTRCAAVPLRTSARDHAGRQAWLSRISTDSAYFPDVLLPLLVIGIGQVGPGPGPGRCRGLGGPPCQPGRRSPHHLTVARGARNREGCGAQGCWGWRAAFGADVANDSDPETPVGQVRSLREARSPWAKPEAPRRSPKRNLVGDVANDSAPKAPTNTSPPRAAEADRTGGRTATTTCSRGQLAGPASRRPGSRGWYSGRSLALANAAFTAAESAAMS